LPTQFHEDGVERTHRLVARTGVRGRERHWYSRAYLILYTDGLSEAENLSQEQFGDDRLIRLFQTRPYDNARQTVDMVKTAVTAFVGEAEPSDDLTMLCIKIK